MPVLECVRIELSSGDDDDRMITYENTEPCDEIVRLRFNTSGWILTTRDEIELRKTSMIELPVLAVLMRAIRYAVYIAADSRTMEKILFPARCAWACATDRWIAQILNAIRPASGSQRG